jgi:hypothetical protein
MLFEFGLENSLHGRFSERPVFYLFHGRVKDREPLRICAIPAFTDVRGLRGPL